MSKVQKSKYKIYNIKKAKKSLNVNLKGFLCSCNNREKDCIKESYNLLNKYNVEDIQDSSLDTPKDDIQDELEMEIAQLKSNVTNQKFQVVESGAKNIIFISTTLDDPVQLALRIVSNIEETKTQETRFLIRLVPIETTCKAQLKDIENAFKPLSVKHFKDEPKTFSIVYNHRHNNSLNKDDVIKAVADIIFETRSDHKVNLKQAEVSVIIEIIKGTALIGVVPKFIHYKKYNLLALSGQTDENEKQTETLETPLDAVDTDAD